VADVVDGASLVRVREFKQAAKAQKKGRGRRLSRSPKVGARPGVQRWHDGS
jgi:hypothetical protein